MQIDCITPKGNFRILFVFKHPCNVVLRLCLNDIYNVKELFFVRMPGIEPGIDIYITKYQAACSVDIRCAQRPFAELFTLRLPFRHIRNAKELKS